MNETETRHGMLTADDNLRRWTRLCSACDAGMGACSCPRDDPRPLVEQLWHERDDARVELSRLRAVVEAVQALADEWDEERRPGMVGISRALRAALAPVSSSGEAGSGEATCATCGGSGFIPEADDPDCPEADVHQTHCPDCPAPVPSGGQADGEAEASPLDGTVSTVDLAICVNCREKITRYGIATAWYHVGHCGVHGEQRCQKAATDALAARPVLSREALAHALIDQLVRVQVPNVGTATGFLRRESADHLADVLAGGEQA